MTMIAINTNYNVPIIIGDLLITGDEKPGKFILPSIGNDILDQVNQNSSSYPRWLTQKVYILQDNLVIAFAGNGQDIKNFLTDIKLFARIYENVTLEQLTTWLKEYEFEDGNVISFAILFAEKKAEETTLSQILFGNWEKVDSTIYESTVATGTGAEDFLAEASSDQGFTTVHSPGEGSYALQSNIILLAKLLAKERFNLSNIHKHWGGGFEVTYFDGTKFSKIDELVYLIFQARQEEDGNLSIPIPALLMHYEYVEEVLLITVLDMHKGQTEEIAEQLIATSQNFSVTRFVVTPFDYAGEINLGKFQLDTSFEVNRIAMGYIVETSKGTILPASFYTGEGMQITYKHVDDLKIVMDRRLNDNVVNSVYTWLNQHSV
jgi:hypothetical protein